jgi:CheY-like chemotaxis protein
MTGLDACVLIADDEPLIANIVKRAVDSMGVRTIVVASGTQAIDVTQQRHACLVGAILDVMMPGTNGIEVAEFLRQTRPDLPIVFMSGGMTPAFLCHINQMPRTGLLE